MRQRHRWHIGEVLLPDGTEPLLNRGIWLDDTRHLHADVHHIGHVLDFCLTTFGVPIATNALADAIRAIAGSDVQSIPITISEQSGMMVLNATRVVRCVNEQYSEFQKFGKDDPVRPDLAGQYRHISKLVLDKKSIPMDAHFFRVKDWEVGLIVSEAVKSAMEKVGCFGAKFVKLEIV